MVNLFPEFILVLQIQELKSLLKILSPPPTNINYYNSILFSDT